MFYGINEFKKMSTERIKGQTIVYHNLSNFI